MARLTQEQKDRIVEMRRTHSLKEISTITEIPLGTVRTICFRAGVKAPTTNSEHMSFFKLPEPQEGPEGNWQCSKSQRSAETGDRELDAFLWLLKVIDSGEPALIERALRAAEGMESTSEDLSDRYSRAVMASTGNIIAAAFAGFGWDNPKGQG